jgi:Glycosyl hydrolase family 3 C terminal domain.
VAVEDLRQEPEQRASCSSTAWRRHSAGSTWARTASPAAGFGGSSIAAWDGLAQTAKSHDGLELQQAAFTTTFTAGESHDLDLRAYANATNPLSVRFEWVPPDWQARSIAAAVTAAQNANKVVIFAYDDGTEGSDRGGNDQNVGLELPGWQDDLISASRP